MSYSWYRVDGSFIQHPKTLALQAALNEPLADAYVVRLWSWVHCYAPTGRIPSRVTAQLESAIGWRGSPNLLIQTLTEVGFLEPVSDGFLVHDWCDYQGVFAQKAKKDAAKKRQRRRRAVTPPVTPLSRVTAPPTRRDETNETKQTNETQAATAPPPAAKNLPTAITPPTSPPDGWMGEDFWRWAESTRQTAGCPPQGPPHPAKLSGWWSTARAMCEVEPLQDAFLNFGDDAYWQAQKPALPFGGFMAQWNKYLNVGRRDAS